MSVFVSESVQMKAAQVQGGAECMVQLRQHSKEAAWGQNCFHAVRVSGVKKISVLWT